MDQFDKRSFNYNPGQPHFNTERSTYSYATVYTGSCDAMKIHYKIHYFISHNTKVACVKVFGMNTYTNTNINTAYSWMIFDKSLRKITSTYFDHKLWNMMKVQFPCHGINCFGFVAEISSIISPLQQTDICVLLLMWINVTQCPWIQHICTYKERNVW